ncbi:MAG: hypothetical protein ACI8RZ_005827 [Myxococcota bacterium]|jgi:hypothetical protein
MMLLTLLASLTASAAPPPTPAAAPEDCQLSPAAIPAFTLVDENPSSVTYGQEVSTSDLNGAVLVMYWAQAS